MRVVRAGPSQAQYLHDVRFLATTDYVHLMRGVAADVRSADILRNKYLYFGSHGAYLWGEIHKNYQPGLHGKLLIERHFGRIHQYMKSVVGEECGYDVISLGTGTGDDDIAILNAALSSSRCLKEMSVICIDLSWPLLLSGVSSIAHWKAQTNNTSNLTIAAICCDIDALGDSSEYIQPIPGSPRSNKHALFHLLGLTLGNNAERAMLGEIAHVMLPGDHLLIGVDVSGDSPLEFNKTRVAYEVAARSLIDEFLCGPLLTAVQFSLDRGTSEGTARLSSTWRYEDRELDWVPYPIRVEHGVLSKGDTQALSDVPEAQALVRYHVSEKDGKFRRLCDFSTKYTHEGILAFLHDLQKVGIPLEVVTDAELGRLNLSNSSHELLLVRRTERATRNSVVDISEWLTELEAKIPVLAELHGSDKAVAALVKRFWASVRRDRNQLIRNVSLSEVADLLVIPPVGEDNCNDVCAYFSQVVQVIAGVKQK